MYSGMPKSELVSFSDDQLLVQFQMVQYSDGIQNLNVFVRIWDNNLCPKMERPKQIRSDFHHLGLFSTNRMLGFEPMFIKAQAAEIQTR